MSPALGAIPSRTTPGCCHQSRPPATELSRVARPWGTHYHTCTSFDTARRQSLACNSFLGKLFGNKSTETAQRPVTPPSAPSVATKTAADKPELVLLETTTEDGSTARIIYRDNFVIEPAALEKLCTKVGWPARELDKVEIALRNSYVVGSLHVQVQRAGRDAAVTETLIGAARCTSDHAFNATIWDVLVDPDYQGQGLGKALVEQMVRSLLSRGINNINLYADAKVVDFYRQLGFESDTAGIRGMFWYPQ